MIINNGEFILEENPQVWNFITSINIMVLIWSDAILGVLLKEPNSSSNLSKSQRFSNCSANLSMVWCVISSATRKAILIRAWQASWPRGLRTSQRASAQTPRTKTWPFCGCRSRTRRGRRSASANISQRSRRWATLFCRSRRRNSEIDMGWIIKL